MTDAFAARASEWDANPVRAALQRAFRAEVLAEAAGLLPGGRVLELGCGTGAVGLSLAGEIGPQGELLFVDTSPAMLAVLRGKLAQRPGLRARVFEGELEALALPEGGVDLALTLMALHHVADVPALLRALRRALKPGGLLLAGDLLSEDGSFHGPDPVAHNGFDPGELAGLCAQCGFGPLRTRLFHTLRKPDASDASGAPRAYGVFLLAAVAA